MKKSRFTDEQIIGFLEQAEGGMPVKELCRLGGFSDATFYKWRAKFGGMQASEATRLRENRERERQAQEAAGRGPPAHRSAEGGLRGKALTPQARREAAARMVQELSISERRACCYAGLSRTSYRERPSMNESTASLSTRIVEQAHERRRFGYRRIHDLLSLEGHQVNHKRVWRLYKRANLSVRKRRKVKRPAGERQPLVSSRHVNDTWSADFVMDALASGRRIKCLTVVDDFSRECVDIAVDHGMGGEYVVRLLEQAAQLRGYPLAIRTDRGPEFTSRAFMAWAAARGIRHLLNDAGCPTQNAYIESFNGKFRDECLNEQWFETLAQARQEVARWRRGYNEVRPHSSLGRIPPASFAALHRQRAGDARQSPEIK